MNWSDKFLDKAKKELPEGVAMFFVQQSDTVCLLVRAEGKRNHNLPPLSRFEVLAAGVAFFNLNDNPDEEDADKGRYIALGRALKMYHEKMNAERFLIAGDNSTNGAFMRRVL